MKEKLILEYIIYYLKYFEKNIEESTNLIFFMIRLRIQEIEKLNENQLKTLNETMKKQLEE